jgi:hypothetical protein
VEVVGGGLLKKTVVEVIGGGLLKKTVVEVIGGCWELVVEWGLLGGEFF